VDAVFLGAGDLSLSLGASMSDPAVRALLDQGHAAAREAGKPCGAVCAGPDAAVQAAARGHEFLIMGNDATMLARTAHSMTRSFREGHNGTAS
jgi:2-keto-3-deoxy-L-rhamnonate aldolase RhmA